MFTAGLVVAGTIAASGVAFTLSGATTSALTNAAAFHAEASISKGRFGVAVHQNGDDDDSATETAKLLNPRSSFTGQVNFEAEGVISKGRYGVSLHEKVLIETVDEDAPPSAHIIMFMMDQARPDVFGKGCKFCDTS